MYQIIKTFRCFEYMKKITLLTLIALLGAACNQHDKKETKAVEPTSHFIERPLKDVDVPFKEYTVDAEKGDTLIYPTGSIILFPPNAFVDEAGNIIKGKVQVTYREFTSPIDFYLAGIPMDYDSAGKKYVFESSGMFEINAYKDNKPVFVNPNSKPEVNISTKNDSPGHNIYYLDTVQKKWVNQGTSVITNLGIADHAGKTVATPVINVVEVVPVMPEKANGSSPVIRIEVDPSSFREFADYNNVCFQVDEKATPYNTKDTSEEWNNIELIKRNKDGKYTVKFSNARKSVSYVVKPVFNGQDYQKALQAFEEKQAAYKRKLEERAKKAKAERAAYIKDSLEMKAMEKRNARTGNSRIYRSVTVNRFGTWNCDKSLILNYVFLRATFKDEQGNVLELKHIKVLLKAVNGLLWARGDNMIVVAGTDNMLVAAYGDRLAYLTYEDFEKLNITADTKVQTFIMKIVSKEDNNYNYIRDLTLQ